MSLVVRPNWLALLAVPHLLGMSLELAHAVELQTHAPVAVRVVRPHEDVVAFLADAQDAHRLGDDPRMTILDSTCRSRNASRAHRGLHDPASLFSAFHS